MSKLEAPPSVRQVSEVQVPVKTPKTIVTAWTILNPRIVLIAVKLGESAQASGTVKSYRAESLHVYVVIELALSLEQAIK